MLVDQIRRSSTTQILGARPTSLSCKSIGHMLGSHVLCFLFSCQDVCQNSNGGAKANNVDLVNLKERVEMLTESLKDKASARDTKSMQDTVTAHLHAAQCDPQDRCNSRRFRTIRKCIWNFTCLLKFLRIIHLFRDFDVVVEGEGKRSPFPTLPR